jgi:hypothetical protein
MLKVHEVNVVASALVGAPSGRYIELVQGPSGSGLVGRLIGKLVRGGKMDRSNNGRLNMVRVIIGVGEPMPRAPGRVGPRGARHGLAQADGLAACSAATSAK